MARLRCFSTTPRLSRGRFYNQVGAPLQSAARWSGSRHTSANTDVLMQGEMLSWSRSRGVSAGLSLEGATLRPDDKENQKLYRREISNREILENGVAVPPTRTGTCCNPEPHSVVRREKEAIDVEPLKTPGGRVILNETVVHFATNEWAVPANPSSTTGARRHAGN
jgi:hypothetical protein